MKLVSNMAVLAALALSNQIFAETPTATGGGKSDAAKGQQIATQICAACHNADGNSSIPANPSLAGQHAEYITKQLKNFKLKDGKPAERENPIMSAMVEPLSPEDMKNLGAYYAQQTPKPGAAKDKALAEQGEKIYRGGNLETSVPACAGCHSPNGVGIPPNYPRLSGQHPEYLVAQLRAFRLGERANAPMMMTIAAKMTDAEMQAVTDYMQGLR